MTTSRLTLAIGSLALSLAPALARVAAAQPAAGAQAEVLFDEGRALMAKQQYAAACAKFDSSQQLEPAITTLVNEADCREKNNQLATAWGLFLDTERQTRTASDATGQKLHDVAQKRAAKLAERLSKLTIKVPDVARLDGLELALGTEKMSPGSWNTALPMDGGTYTITARAPNHQTWTKNVTVGNERDNQIVDVPKLGAESAAPVATTNPTPPPPVTTTPPTEVAPAPNVGTPPQTDVQSPEWTAGGQRSLAPPIATTVATVALGGAALGVYLWSHSLYNQSKTEADDTKQTSLWNEANSRYHIAQGLGIASAAAAGVSIYLWIRASHHAEPQSATATLVVPVATGDQLGFALTGSFR